MTLRVQFLGPWCQPTGYGRALHDYLLALKPRIDLDFKVLPIAPATRANLEPRYKPILDNEGAFRVDPPDVCVVHTIPTRAHELVTGEMTPPASCAKVCLTTWETDTLPETVAKNLADNFDMVIVPSTFCRSTMAEHTALAPKLRVVPHTFDSEFWGMPEAGFLKSDRFKGDTRYAFYSIGSWVERKNPIGLLKAYLTAFTSKDDVVLRMLTPAVSDADVGALGRALNLPNLPEVEFYGREGKGKGPSYGRFSEDDLLALHWRSQCYVSLTRGEGWNLGAFEAAVVGNLVIATEFGGHLDYLQRYDGFSPVDKMMTPAVVPETMSGRECVIGGIKIAPMSRAAPPGLDGSQNWAEPDLIHAQFGMRAAYRDRANFARSHDEMDDFTYPKVSDLLAGYLKEVKRGA